MIRVNDYRLQVQFRVVDLDRPKYKHHDVDLQETYERIQSCIVRKRNVLYHTCHYNILLFLRAAYCSGEIGESEDAAPMLSGYIHWAR